VEANEWRPGSRDAGDGLQNNAAADLEERVDFFAEPMQTSR
jgi:hypothetical protein